jgi:hypothetical protein
MLDGGDGMYDIERRGGDIRKSHDKPYDRYLYYTLYPNIVVP